MRVQEIFPLHFYLVENLGDAGTTKGLLPTCIPHGRTMSLCFADNDFLGTQDEFVDKVFCRWRSTNYPWTCARGTGENDHLYRFSGDALGHARWYCPVEPISLCKFVLWRPAVIGLDWNAE